MLNGIFDADTERPCSPLCVVRCRPIRRRRTARRLALPLLFLALCGNSATWAASPGAPATAPPDATQTTQKFEESRIWLSVGKRRFAVTLADTEAARAFASMLPLTLDMEELNGNEKKKELSNSLSTDASRPGMIRTGDLLLWGARTVVIFYLTFDSSYSYTRLGRIDAPDSLAETLGRQDVQVVFSKD